MAIAYALGEALVGNSELIEKHSLDRFRSFAAASVADRQSLEFSTGTARSEDLVMRDASGDRIAITDIEIGKPLTLAIRHLYTGKFPTGGFLGGNTKDLLVTSNVKSIGAYEGAPEAINLLRERVPRQEDIRVVGADEKGTPYILYTKSLTKGDTVVTVKMDHDDFDKSAFDAIGSGLSQLSGVPLFAPAQPWLLLGSMVAPLVGKIFTSILEKRHFFRATESVFLTFPGSQKAKAGYRLMMADDHFEAIKDDFKVSDEGRLVAKADGRPYSGDNPYAVLLIDGANRDDELEKFQATAATASVLEKFRPEGDSPFPLDELIKLVEASSDFTYRRRADKLNERIKALGDGAENEEERKKLEKERNANIANVKSTELKKDYS
jgi:hypothetical protein